jgi:hypothetical protein
VADEDEEAKYAFCTRGEASSQRMGRKGVKGKKAEKLLQHENKAVG